MTKVIVLLFLIEINYTEASETLTCLGNAPIQPERTFLFHFPSYSNKQKYSFLDFVAKMNHVVK